MDAASPRALSAGFTLSYGLVAAGWFVLGLAALWNRAYPRAAVALLMAGAALTWLYSADQAPARNPRER